jgi:sulfoxide reductase heme-binding subunit YedZ
VTVLAAMNEHTWWWLSRSTGMVAWALSVAAIVWGLALSGRVVRRKRLPAWLLDLHKYLGTLTLAFVAVHMGALTLDNYVAFDAKDLFVPMASSWKAGAVTWGIAAFYVLVVIQVTSWGMKWLPRKVWHGIHFSSFFVFGAATVHGIMAGTDAQEPIVQMGALVGVTLLLTLVFLRVVNSMNAADDTAVGAKAAAAKARAARAQLAASVESAEPFETVEPFAPELAAVVHAGRTEEQWDDGLVTHAGVDHLGDEHGVVTPADGVGDPALEPVGQVDEDGGAGLWASLEAEAVERVPLDRGRPEEGLPYIKLVFPEHVDGEGAGALDDGVGVAVGLDADHHERRVERGL